MNLALGFLSKFFLRQAGCKFVSFGCMVFPPALFMSRRLQYLLRMCTVHNGVPRLDGAQGKKQVWRPHVQSWSLSEANVLYWRKYLWHWWDFLAHPIVIRRPGKCVPPSLCAWLCSISLKPCSEIYVVGNTSGNKANFQKTLTALYPSLAIGVNEIWHRLDHRFGSRWKVPGCGITLAYVS